MIIHVNGLNNAVSVSGSTITIDDFSFRGNMRSGETIDLTPYQGQTVRIYLNENGTVSVYPTTTHYWLLAEINVPPREFEYVDTGEVGEVDDLKMPIMQQIPIPLDLSAVDIRVWALPEVK